MFGASNPFGQASSSSPFGTQTQSVFGQNNNGSSNPFGQPFGTSSPFGAQTGSSMFGGTATGVFGAAQVSSPFGASSQGFGNSTPAFGASSAPAFGNSSSPFGGTSTFGQKPFGFSTPQSSPFGSSTPQSQPAFGNNTFAPSTPFGASSTPAFGASSTPGFASTNTSPFGASSTPPFGSTNTSPFGASSTPAFGSTNTSPFGASSTPAFGASSSPAFGASPTPAFGNSGIAFGNNTFGTGGAFGAPSTPAFGASSTPAFGASSTPAFGASSTPSFGFNSSPAFGQSTSAAFSSGTLGPTQSPFGVQGAQGGSRVMSYACTSDPEACTSGGAPGKIQSISAMPIHTDKCHEELRWADYQRGDKGGKLPAGQSTNAFSPNQTNAFAQTSANLTNTFSSTVASNPFGTPTTNTIFSSPFNQNTTPSMFGPTSSNTTSVFGPSSGFPTTTTQPFGSSSTSAFGSSSSMFSSLSNPGFASSSSVFSSGPAQGTASLFSTGGNFNNSQSAPLFSSTPSFAQNTNTAFPQPSNFSTPSTGFSNTFTSSPSLSTSTSPFSQTKPAAASPFQSTQPSFTFNNSGQTQSPFQSTQPSQPSFSFNNPGQTQTPFQSTQPSQTTQPAFSFNNPGQTQTPFQSTQPSQTTQPAFSFNNPGQTQTPFQSTQPSQPTQPAFSFNNPGQTQTPFQSTQPTKLSFSFNNPGQIQTGVTANSSVMQPNPVANPFGTLPALPQLSIAQGGNPPSIQYGISSLPVVDKATPARVSPVLTCRHLLQRRVMLPARKYRPGDESPKVPFFSDEENSNTPKADAFFIPRENPRALFILPLKKDISAPHKGGPAPLEENGKRSNGVTTNEANDENKGEIRDAPPVKANEKQNGTNEKHGGDKNGSKISPSGADIESLMPKLQHAEYFTEPRIQEIAAKEKVNPGYSGRVRDFVVGRHGYGSIKFLGETDVRKLDLEMLVQFNNREVIVYMDESKKPPVGQGLNKPAEVTLLNIKCTDKKSGKQVKDGPRVEKYKEMLKRKAEEQGAQFVSYDAENGEWKFKVEHF